MKSLLSINLNKIALLRNQRDVGYPCPVAAGRVILAAGADGLTIHPRPDQRHIRYNDAYEIDRMLRDDGYYSRNIELNIEGNPFDDFMKICRDIKPQQVTLVPDDPMAATSDSGWDVFASEKRLRPIITELKSYGCRVALFMNHDSENSMAKVKDIGGDRIELYTGPYAAGFDGDNKAAIMAQYTKTANAAHANGLGVNAGHDLTIENLPYFKSSIKYLDEVSIGHAFTTDALYMGFDAAVKSYLNSLSR